MGLFLTRMLAKITVIVCLTIFSAFIVSVTLVCVIDFFVKKWKKRTLKKTDNLVRKYFSEIDHTKEFPHIDETPCAIDIGERVFWIKPLKYKHLMRLLSVFGNVLDKINYRSKDMDTIIKELTELCEDDVLKALSYIIILNKDEGITKDIGGELKEVDLLYYYVKANITVNQLTRVINILVMQNDVKQFIDNFNRFIGVKKKI